MGNLRNAVDAIVPYALAGSINQAMIAREKECVNHHGAFLSEEERELVSQVDALLVAGRKTIQLNNYHVGG